MSRHNYKFEASYLPNLDYEVENYMNVYEHFTSNQNVDLRDSASTYTILTKTEFFHFQSKFF